MVGKMPECGRNIRVPKRFGHFRKDQLGYALHRLLFNPPQDIHALLPTECELVQKRFYLTPEDEHLLEQVKEIFCLRYDVEAVLAALVYSQDIETLFEPTDH